MATPSNPLSTFFNNAGQANIFNTYTSTSTNTGALVIAGGVGIAGAAYHGGNVQIYNSNPTITLGDGNKSSPSSSNIYFNQGTTGIPGSISYSSSNFYIQNNSGLGGIYFSTYTLNANNGNKLTITGNDGNVNITSTVTSTATNVGALTVNGGIGILKDMYVGGGIFVSGAVTATSFVGTLTGSASKVVFQQVNASNQYPVTLADAGNQWIRYNSLNEFYYVPGGTAGSGVGGLYVGNTTISTSTNSGALIVNGGLGVWGAVNIGQTSTIAGAQIITTATIGNYAATGASTSTTSSNILINTDTVSATAQYVTFVSVSTGSTTLKVNATNGLVYVPSTNFFGIGTNGPTAPLSLSKSYTTVTGGEQFGLYMSTNYTVPDGSLKQGIRNNTIASNTTGTVNSLIGVLNLMYTANTGTTIASAQNYWSRIDVLLGSTITNAFHYTISDTGNTGVAVNQYGYYVPSLTSAANNWAYYSSGFYTPSYLAGALGIGTTSLAGFNLRVARNLTSSTNAYSIHNAPAVQSDVSNVYGFNSQPTTQATAFTLTNYYHYNTVDVSKGAGSTVTTQIAFYSGSLVGAANNYGFFGNVTYAPGNTNYNLYMGTTATNYLAGSLGINNTIPSYPLDVFSANSLSARIQTSGAGYAELLLATNGGTSYITAPGSTNLSFFLNATRMTVASSGTVNISTVSNAISTTTGALTLAGGLGVGQAIYANTINTVDSVGSPSSLPGLKVINGNSTLNFIGAASAGAYNSIVQSGDSLIYWTAGAQGSGNLVLAPWSSTSTGVRITNTGSVNIPSWTQSINTTTGALTVYGGVGIGGNLYVGGSIIASSTLTLSVTTASNIFGGLPGQLHYQSTTSVTSFVTTATAGQVLTSNGSGMPLYQNTMTLAGATAATSTQTGALIVQGGVGIGERLYVGSSATIASGLAIGTTQYAGAAVTAKGYSWFDNFSGDNQTRASGVTVATAPSSNWAIGSDPGDGLRNTSFISKGATRSTIITLRNVDNSTGFWDIVADGSTSKLYFQHPYAGYAAMNIATTGTVTISTSSNSISTTTGALVVAGGIGVGGNVNINGSLNAITKSFVIGHPTKPGMKLRYGSLEGPENGVYVRGRLKGSTTIQLPDYWTKLVDPDSITVTLTPIGKHQKLYVEAIKDNTVIVENDAMFGGSIDCYYVVFAERADTDKLAVEIPE
jgi:hypothetical protein